MLCEARDEKIKNEMISVLNSGSSVPPEKRREMFLRGSKRKEASWSDMERDESGKVSEISTKFLGRF